MAQIGKDKVRVSVMGPESQLKAIRPKMEERGARYTHPQTYIYTHMQTLQDDSQLD